MSAVDDRRNRARDAFYQEMIIGDQVAVRALDNVVNVATRVRMTHEIVLAFIQAPDTGADQDDITGPLRAAFEAAGFEVVQ